jgi:hypothetical protein
MLEHRTAAIQKCGINLPLGHVTAKHADIFGHNKYSSDLQKWSHGQNINEGYGGIASDEGSKVIP